MFIYCTYITIYSGNKLPPFYIGYTSLSKINNGYRGTVSSKRYKQIWKKELKTNPNLFKTKILSYHETQILAVEKEHKFLSSLNVHKNMLYINCHNGANKFCAPWENKDYRDKMLTTINQTHKNGKIWTEKRRQEQSINIKEVNRKRTPESRRLANLKSFDLNHYKMMSMNAASNPETIKTRSKTMATLNSIKKQCPFCDMKTNAGTLARHIKSKHQI